MTKSTAPALPDLNDTILSWARPGPARNGLLIRIWVALLIGLLLSRALERRQGASALRPLAALWRSHLTRTLLLDVSALSTLAALHTFETERRQDPRSRRGLALLVLALGAFALLPITWWSERQGSEH
jgi:hypothetical protein